MTTGKQKRPAVVLLSGGLDSTTCLAIANDEGFEPHCLAVSYGQRHTVELEAAKRVAAKFSARSFRVVSLSSLNRMTSGTAICMRNASS